MSIHQKQQVTANIDHLYELIKEFNPSITKDEVLQNKEVYESWLNRKEEAKKFNLEEDKDITRVSFI